MFVMHSVINIRLSLLFSFGILQLPSAAKNDEKLDTHILIQGVYKLYRKVAYHWVEP